jgi:diguanylate cyclase (GGDEF)-like protein
MARRKGARKTRILVAEDEPVSLRLLQACLVEWGYEVTSARDGQKALEVLQSPESPRLAILDWVMPGRDGIDICREVRKRRNEPYLYLLMLTSKARKQDIVEGLESGADDYLVKPYDPQELRARLRAGRRILDLQEQLVSAHRLIEAQMTVDPLTGVWSRNVILDILKVQLTLSSQVCSPMSLVLANVDRFRGITATFGPLAGDAVLREVARRIRGALRPPDSIGRCGAEEFAMVLPGCDTAAAANLAEKFRARVDRRDVDTSEALIPVTVSLGVVVTPSEKALDLERVWRLATEAVARAKANGHDRVEFATL